MRTAIYDRVEPPMPGALPLRLTQTCAQRPATLFLAILVPVALAMTLACAALVWEAVLLPQARTLLQQRPILAIELLTAIAGIVYMVLLPTRRLIARLATTRVVEIAHGAVKVTEGSHFRTWTWSAPLGEYSGLAHHVRASLSGTRHELIMVHPERVKCVLLCVAPWTSQSEVERVATLVGLKQIPPGELYRFKGLWPRMATPPLPEAAHA